MFKVGDKVLCKKSLQDIYDSDFLSISSFFIPGEHYKIVEIRKSYYNQNCIRVSDEFNMKAWDFLTEEYPKFHHSDIYSPIFSDHFYTKQEERKLKLNKINGI